MMDFKYHVTTITAIFFALAAGILFGIGVARQNAVQGLAAKSMQRLSAEFQRVMDEDRKVSAQNTALEASLNARDQFEREMLPFVVTNRLAGKRIALILTGDHGEAKYLHSLTRSIEIAGGSIVSTTLMKDQLLPVDPDSRQELLNRFSVTPDESQPPTVGLSAALARTIAFGQAPRGLKRAAQLTDGLVAEGDYTRPVDAVVLISSAEQDRSPILDSGNSIESGVISALKETGIRLVACETGGPYSFTSYLQRTGVSTVDSVDQAPGQVALILTLAGARGSYGLKPGAIRVTPPLEGSAQ